MKQKLRRLHQWLNSRVWWSQEPLWKRYLTSIIGWTLAILFFAGTVVVPIWEDMDSANQRKACEAKHLTKCERQWAPIKQ